MVTSIVERAGVKGEKEDMVVVGRVGREVEADTGQISYSFLNILIFICLPYFLWHTSVYLFSISGRVGNTVMGIARGSIVTATIASASTDTV